MARASSFGSPSEPWTTPVLTTHVESFRRALSELMPLLPLHYEKLALNKDRVPLDPNFEFYFQKEDLGELSFRGC